MNQAYGDDFARLYDSRWATFAMEAAPLIHAFHASRSGSDLPPRMLDLCCGTGQLTRYFLDHGFRATGVDLSDAMLTHARRNAGHHLQDGTADFVQADASDFELSETFGLVVSTYDALNHLPHLEALRTCLVCAARVTVPGGRFVFDLNTRQGLYRWNGTVVWEGDDGFVVQRSHYDGGDRAETLLTGFVPEPDATRYRRFDEAVFNTVFDLADVARLAEQTGWNLYFAVLEDLAAPLAQPELEGRVFAVATRSAHP